MMNNLTATIDIETPPILERICDISKIYCVALKIKDTPTKAFTQTRLPYTDGTFKDLKRVLLDIDTIVGHNIVKFDIPVLKNVLGIDLSKKHLLDTLLISKLQFNSDSLYEVDKGIKDMPTKLFGRFSLKAFGYRLGDNKIEFEDFSTGLSKEMVTYCKQDVDLAYKLYQKLKSLGTYPSKQVLNVETEFAKAIYQQEQYGFYFDIKKARELAVKLQFRMSNIEHKLQKVFKPLYISKGVVTPKTERKSKIYLKDKNFSILKQTSCPLSRYKKPKRAIDPVTGIASIEVYKPYKGKFFKEPTKVIYTITVGEYEKIELQKFNPASREQCKTRLKKLGWEPLTYTDKGSPQLNSEVIQKSLERI